MLLSLGTCLAHSSKVLWAIRITLKRAAVWKLMPQTLIHVPRKVVLIRDSAPVLPLCASMYFGLGRPSPLLACTWNGRNVTIMRRQGFSSPGPQCGSDSLGRCSPKLSAELECSSLVQLLRTNTTLFYCRMLHSCLELSDHV